MIPLDVHDVGVRIAYERVEFRSRVLRDVSEVDTTTTILGRTSELPLVFAPTGFTRMMHTEGERAVARVAARVGIPYALSTMGTTSIEGLAAEAPDARLWFQLYLWRDREASRDFVERAPLSCFALSWRPAASFGRPTKTASPNRRSARSRLPNHSASN